MTFKYRWASVIGGKLHKFSHPEKDIVLGMVSDFLRKNNIKFSEKEVIEQIERQSKPSSYSIKPIGLQDAFRGANAILNYVSGNSVSEDESMRRSAICQACPLSSTVAGCSSCGLAGKITKFVNTIKKNKGNYAIPNYISSKFCSFCGCSLPLMVVTKLENFKKESDLDNARRPDNCWLKKTSKNFTNE
jgi:hypothetical protein